MQFFSDKTIIAKPIEAGEILMRKMEFQFGERLCRKESRKYCRTTENSLNFSRTSNGR